MSHYRTIAEETVRLCHAGSYRLTDGTTIDLATPLAAARAGTRLYLPDGFAPLWAELAATPAPAASTVTRVVNTTTLAAAQDLRQRYERVILLNFASARNPGGGFLKGAQAQEESVARSSGLYPTLLTQRAFYDYHREHRTALYSDRVIYSPDVPVIRDEHEQLAPLWTVGMLTAAATNQGAMARNEPENLVHLRPAMARRVRYVLAIATAHQAEALVLGAWGCGVFQCDPVVIAALFAEALAEPALQNRFREIIFAVYARRETDPNLTAFQTVFASSHAA